MCEGQEFNRSNGKELAVSNTNRIFVIYSKFRAEGGRDRLENEREAKRG